MRDIIPIQKYGKSYALLSEANRVETAIVFVHGLGGKPTETWLDFQTLVDSTPEDSNFWSESDLFFYTYDSTKTPVRRNAQILGEFVVEAWYGELHRKSRLVIRLRDEPITTHRYRHLILVGHSLGGVLIRRLILDEFERLKRNLEDSNPDLSSEGLRKRLKSEVDSNYILNSQIRLFAPACMGINFSSAPGFLMEFSRFLQALSATSVVRNELTAGSPILLTLQAGTEKAHKEFRKLRALYTRPLFGTADTVVYAESYEGEEPIWANSFDHISICKPNSDYALPLTFVHGDKNKILQEQVFYD